MKTSKIIFYINLCISVALMVGGFFVPPKGVIDGSVLTGAGLLFAFTALACFTGAIEAGKDFKMSHGDTSVEINQSDG